MTKRGRLYLSILLWTWGGVVYYLAEIIYKSVAGRQDSISWTMLFLAILLSIPIERLGGRVPYPLPVQGLACAALITGAEFLAGLVLNVWLGLGIWDYSGIPGNVMGQICLPFTGLWLLVSLVCIPLFDHIRGEIERGVK